MNLGHRLIEMCGKRCGVLSAPLLPAALLLAGCVNIENIAPSVSRLSSNAPSSQLTQGREIYVSVRCTSCHVAEPISKYPLARWPGIVEEMGDEAKLSPSEKQALLAYVLAAHAAPPVVKQ